MIHKIYQKQVEAWKEKIAKHGCLSCWSDDLSGNCTCNSEKEAMSSLLLSRHKDIIELIEAEIERKKEQKEQPIKWDGSDVCTHYQENCSCSPSKEKCRKHNQRVAIKNKVIDEDIAYLEEQIKLIKKEI